VNQKVILLLKDTDKSTTTSGFALAEVSFALGISAKGHIGFPVGVEAGGDHRVQTVVQAVLRSGVPGRD